MSCHVMSCHVMSCHVMSCHVMSCHVMSCHVMSCHVMSCHAMSCHVMSCHVMSCHVMSCHVMSCHVMLCYYVMLLDCCCISVTCNNCWRYEELERINSSSLFRLFATSGAASRRSFPFDWLSTIYPTVALHRRTMFWLLHSSRSVVEMSIGGLPHA